MARQNTINAVNLANPASDQILDQMICRFKLQRLQIWKQIKHISDQISQQAEQFRPRFFPHPHLARMSGRQLGARYQKLTKEFLQWEKCEKAKNEIISMGNNYQQENIDILINKGTYRAASNQIVF